MKFIRSLGHAWHGVQHCYNTQLNFRIDLLVLSIVIIAGLIFKINTSEWLFIIVCSALVLALELVNTAIEYLCDIITKDINPAIKVIKDVSAAAVLVAAFLSAVTGIIIFLPKIIALLKS
jgi:diacylglycerol kinase